MLAADGGPTTELVQRRADSVDVAVIGAGFGGLGAALALAERGARVRVCESLVYPGGCASTFTRRGCRFESGATLFSGFGEGQLFARWIDRYGLDVRVDFIDPVVTLRAPGMELRVPKDRDAWIDQLVAQDPSRAPRLRRFFAEQTRVADALWALFSEPELLPPFDLRALARHTTRLPRYLPLLRFMGRPLWDRVRAHRLQDFAPLTTFLDAVCQITVQTGAREAEAPFAMATMDYLFRGTGHVRGGIGRLAEGLAGAIRQAGGEVHFADRVKQLVRTSNGRYRVVTRKQTFEADRVVANLLPQTLRALLPADVDVEPRLRALARKVELGWGAVMLYRVLEAQTEMSRSAHHLELIAEPREEFLEGNHVFCSISDAREARAPDRGRTLTVSTHLPMSAPPTAERVARVQARMRETIARLAPELDQHVRFEMTASPRTFERFTGRHLGYVGGVPRRVGLENYRDLWPSEVAPGVYLVGDTVFPGQSTLATALGGVKLADHLAR